MEDRLSFFLTLFLAPLLMICTSGNPSSNNGINADDSQYISCDTILNCSACAMAGSLDPRGCFWCSGKCYSPWSKAPPECNSDDQCVNDHSTSTCTGICPEDQIVPAGFMVKAAQCLLGASNATCCEVNSMGCPYSCNRTFAEIGLTEDEKFENVSAHTAARVSTKGNAIVVAFRATDPGSWSNLEHDLSSIFKTPFASLPGINRENTTGNVGAGFFEVLSLSADPVSCKSS